MFVIYIFRSSYIVCSHVYDLSAKSHMPGTNGSFVIAIRPEGTEKLFLAAMLFYRFYQKRKS
jgi:hypothetical protein